MAVKALPALYGVGLVLFVMRVLPLDDFGRYGLGIYYVNLVAGLSRGLWLAPLIAQSALGQDARVAGPVFWLELATAGAGALGALIALPMLNTGWEVAVLAAIMLPILVPRDIGYSFAQAEGRIGVAFLIEAGYFLGALAGFIWAYYAGWLHSAEVAVLINCIAAALSAVISISAYPRVVKVTFAGDWKHVLSYSRWLGTLTVSDILLQQGDALIAGIYYSPAQIAPYLAGRSLIKFYTLFSQAINFIAFPVASRLAAAGKYKLLKRRMKLALSSLLGVLLPLNLLVWLFCEDLLPLVLGEKYVAGIPFFRVLIFVTFLEPVYSVVSNALVAVGRAKLMTPILVSAVALNIVLNLVLLPTVGVMGAALVLVLSYAVLAIWSYLVIRRQFWQDEETDDMNSGSESTHAAS